ASTKAYDWNTRALGWGCTGAMAAIGLHSVGDFNMHIPANALLLAWIAGMAAALPLGDAERRRTGNGRLDVNRTFAVALACVLVAYGSASVVFARSFRSDVSAERAFCRFGVCDTAAVVDAQTREHGGTVAAVPIGVLQDALR